MLLEEVTLTCQHHRFIAIVKSSLTLVTHGALNRSEILSMLIEVCVPQRDNALLTNAMPVVDDESTRNALLQAFVIRTMIIMMIRLHRVYKI